MGGADLLVWATWLNQTLVRLGNQTDLLGQTKFSEAAETPGMDR